MNSTPLLLLPLAAVALLASQPSKAPVAQPAEAAEVSAILDRPEFQALAAQLQQTTSLLDSPDAPAHRGRRSHPQKREVGLHTGHLSRSDEQAPDGISSGARGLSPEEEWQEMFPRYAMKLAATH